MKKMKLWMLAAILICGTTMVSCFMDTKKSAAVSATDDASQFVTITGVVPDVILEIRYFGTYNFVGTRIDGYEEPTALLTKKAADSLKAVSDDVKAQGYRLKIYDAYRPQKGVDHFVRWAEDVTDTLMKAYFYPDLDKSVLFPQDYICLKSGHTRGSTLDLTLFDMADVERILKIDGGMSMDYYLPKKDDAPDLLTTDEMFKTETLILQDLAVEKSCVVAGRSGFHVFRYHPNHLSILIQASMESRVERVARKQNMSKEEARKTIERVDKMRENYVKKYTGTSRYDTRNYQLVIAADDKTEEEIADIIMQYIG